MNDPPGRCRGLIPARAGKTNPPASRAKSSAAHPRAGGENPSMRAFTVGARGSSPRGRGKRSWRPRRAWCGRLIPARAGKTLLATPQANLGRAHPRAGGENAQGHILTRSFEGSSPRGRGKHGRSLENVLLPGLIPARAGKTTTSPRYLLASRAHPRAGGENCYPCPRQPRAGGSSPRGRGKRTVRAYRFRTRRLIPARAGKTTWKTTNLHDRQAHPRAGGENIQAAVSVVVEWGSSPRGRGKPALP
mgnify:CR=1 FL=1